MSKKQNNEEDDIIIGPGILYVYDINDDGSQGEELWSGRCEQPKFEFDKKSQDENEDLEKDTWLPLLK